MTRRSVAAVPHDRALRLRAKQDLLFPPVQFTGIQARAVGGGFACVVRRTGALIHACAILPDHVHLVIARHRYDIEKLVNLLKGGATRRLIEEGIHPLGQHALPDGEVPCCWARGQRIVFLDDATAVERCIRYVESNPLKEAKPRQHWSFVVPYPALAPRLNSRPGRPVLASTGPALR